jgi:hypothetical protein
MKKANYDNFSRRSPWFDQVEIVELTNKISAMLGGKPIRQVCIALALTTAAALRRHKGEDFDKALAAFNEIVEKHYIEWNGK